MAFRSRFVPHLFPPAPAPAILIHCGSGGMTLSINLNDILVSERAILRMTNNKIKAFNPFSPHVYLGLFILEAMRADSTQLTLRVITLVIPNATNTIQL